MAYTVLREIVDNADGGHGVVACEILLVGTGDLDRRVHSLFDHPALATRIVADVPPGPPIPHQTWMALSADDPTAPLPPVPKPYETSERHAPQLAALVRITQGVPPLEVIPGLTVGMEEVDGRIAQLFETASNDGSVFAASLLGEVRRRQDIGHHLLHLEARALARVGGPSSGSRSSAPRRGPRQSAAALAASHRERDVSREATRGVSRSGFDAWPLAKPAARVSVCATRSMPSSRPTTRRHGRPRAAVAGAPDDEVDDAAVREIFGARWTWSTSRAALVPQGRVRAPPLQGSRSSERLEGCAGPVLILDEAENL